MATIQPLPKRTPKEVQESVRKQIEREDKGLQRMRNPRCTCYTSAFCFWHTEIG